MPTSLRLIRMLAQNEKSVSTIASALLLLEGTHFTSEDIQNLNSLDSSLCVFAADCNGSPRDLSSHRRGPKAAKEVVELGDYRIRGLGGWGLRGIDLRASMRSTPIL